MYIYAYCDVTGHTTTMQSQENNSIERTEDPTDLIDLHYEWVFFLFACFWMSYIIEEQFFPEWTFHTVVTFLLLYFLKMFLASAL